MPAPKTDGEIIASLQAPGAGVPKLHGFFMRHVVAPFIAGRSDWERDSAGFGSVSRKIIKDAEGLTPEQLGTKVLVPPQFGLEDSSRYWSAAMVLEHMMIVSKGISALVVSLSKGVVPDYQVEMARVKPKGELPPGEALAAFKAYAATAMAELDAAVADRKSKAVLEHPWFGKFTAHQWHWLMTAHSVIHLNQMRAICWRLNPPAARKK
ncbi:MAG TPA: DinB family protein [Patescibacteria group bacterium]|nr:DinB family protein [Patescibacteria group bacterium]